MTTQLRNQTDVGNPKFGDPNLTSRMDLTQEVMLRPAF